MPIILVGLVADAVAVDTGVLVGGIILAFATQTIAGWMKLTSLQRDVGSLATMYRNCKSFIHDREILAGVYIALSSIIMKEKREVVEFYRER
ncbi:hypothetical protein LCGC14_2404290 [marine sediment metagenome]|uniref:Uncharacterized protein n=1 Tax=marine sediment metagenome TaxID=412755 RepID=A0A0F9CGG5_9ZZZZ